MTKSRLVSATALLIGLSGCSAVYISSDVNDQTPGLDVRVIELSPETVLLANSQPFVPQTLPDVFFASAGGGTPRGTGALPDPPAYPQLAPGALALQTPPAAEPGPYRLGVGDVLQLTIAANQSVDQITGATQGESLPQDLTVRDDGAVSIPEAGAVEVAGLTIEDAEARIFERLVEAGITPNFGLQISGFNSQRYSVGGAVGSEQVLALNLNRTSLAQALAMAGGLEVPDPEYAAIRLYRDGQLYQIPISAYRDDADLQNIAIMPGDSIFVDVNYDLDRAQRYYESQIDIISLRRADRVAAMDELETEITLRREALDEQRDLFLTREELGANDRDYVYLTGEVSEQTRVPLPFDQQATLADVLYGPGGFPNATGNPSEIYVLRASNDPSAFGAVTAWHLDAAGAAALTLSTRFEMRPDDIVFIEEQPITRWNRAIQQLIPNFLSGLAIASG